MSLLIAIAIGTAVYAAILAIGRDPLPVVDEGLQIPQLQPLPRPTPLGATPGFEAAPAGDRAPEGRQRRDVRIEVRDVDDALRTDGGVATFHTRTGSDFQWFPLADATRDDRGNFQISTSAVSSCQLTITFAAQRAHARHGYLQRLEVDVQQLTPDAPPIELRGAYAVVELQLPTHADQAGPFRLQRADDRMWLPMLHGTSGLALKRGKKLELWLGPGPYELQDPLHPERMQSFTVSGPAKIELSDSLVPLEDDRP